VSCPLLCLAGVQEGHCRPFVVLFSFHRFTHPCTLHTPYVAGWTVVESSSSSPLFIVAFILPIQSMIGSWCVPGGQSCQENDVIAQAFPLGAVHDAGGRGVQLDGHTPARRGELAGMVPWRGRYGSSLDKLQVTGQGRIAGWTHSSVSILFLSIYITKDITRTTDTTAQVKRAQK